MERVEVVGERRPRDLELGLDLPGGHLARLADEEEEDLEPGQVGEGLERLDVVLAGLEPGERERLHISKSMELSKRRQLPGLDTRSLSNSSRRVLSRRTSSSNEVVRMILSNWAR